MVTEKSLRTNVLAAQVGFLAASRALREVLEQLETEVEKGAEHIRDGGRAVDLPSVAGVPTVNPALNERIDALEDARHDARIAYFTMAGAEGLSHGDIGRAWGISRQLVSRIMSRQSGRG